MQYRKGDIVSLTGTVKYDYDQSDEDRKVTVSINGHYSDVWLDEKFVTLITPIFEVGDSVTWAKPTDPPGINSGEIVGLSGEHAWIDMQDGNYCTRHFGAIQRAAPIEPDPLV